MSRDWLLKRAIPELADRLERQQEQHGGGPVVAVDAGVAAVEPQIKNEAFVLIDRIGTDRDHLVRRQVATGITVETIGVPLRRHPDGNLVARKVVSVARRRGSSLVVIVERVVIGIDIAAGQAEFLYPRRCDGFGEMGGQRGLVETRAIGDVEPLGRREGSAGYDV